MDAVEVDSICECPSQSLENHLGASQSGYGISVVWASTGAWFQSYM